MTMPAPVTYTVSRWDGDDDEDGPGGWQPHAESVPLWGVRRALRDLYGCGYSSASVLVRRDDGEETDRARWR